METTATYPDYRRRVHFANGYGASVVRHRHSYGGRDGLFEVAVLRDDELCWDTPVTGDVIGHLPEEEVPRVLADVESLVDETVVCVEVPPSGGFAVGGRYRSVARPGVDSVVVDAAGALHTFGHLEGRAYFRTVGQLRCDRISEALG